MFNDSKGRGHALIYELGTVLTINMPQLAGKLITSFILLVVNVIMI